MITQQELKEALHYDSETGKFTWLSRRGSNALKGSVAGTVIKKGYRTISVGGAQRLAHRLAWLYVHGVCPELQIDHINGDKDDNRLVNLRLATNAQNHCNRGKNVNNRSGYKGVCKKAGANIWIAYAMVAGKTKYLGSFKTPEDASVAYETFAAKTHGEFYRKPTPKVAP